MKKSKGKKSFLFRGFGVLLLIFGFLSLFHIHNSFRMYTAGKKQLKEVRRESEKIVQELEETRSKRYDSGSIGFTDEKGLKKIEIINPPLSPEKDAPFSEKGVRINVIEPE